MLTHIKNVMMQGWHGELQGVAECVALETWRDTNVLLRVKMRTSRLVAEPGETLGDPNVLLYDELAAAAAELTGQDTSYF